MKRLGIAASLVLLLLLVPASEAAAQGFGVKGGLQWSSLRGESGDPALTFGSRSAFIGGLYLDIGIGGVGIRPEILYSRQGAKINEADFPDLKSSFRMDYVQMPLLLRVGGGSMSFFVGPYGAIVLNSKFVVDDPEGGDLVELDIKDDTRSFDYGFVVGIGYSFGVVGLEGRYTYGLAKLFKEEDDAPDLYHRAWGLLLTVGF